MINGNGIVKGGPIKGVPSDAELAGGSGYDCLPRIESDDSTPSEAQPVDPRRVEDATAQALKDAELQGGVSAREASAVDARPVEQTLEAVRTPTVEGDPK
ncbi:MAG TPA: hypothetical protein DEG43_02180, partial [Acidimicrobiaceae bacterium]|nr:hypothetical protein [Acidimicrobiaceae bacterium]